MGVDPSDVMMLLTRVGPGRYDFEIAIRGMQETTRETGVTPPQVAAVIFESMPGHATIHCVDAERNEECGIEDFEDLMEALGRLRRG